MARKSNGKKSKRDRGARRHGYVQDGEPVLLRPRKKCPHVAQEYQSVDHPDVAYELVKHLRDRFRYAVIGTEVRPEVRKGPKLA